MDKLLQVYKIYLEQCVMNYSSNCDAIKGYIQFSEYLKYLAGELNMDALAVLEIVRRLFGPDEMKGSSSTIVIDEIREVPLLVRNNMSKHTQDVCRDYMSGKNMKKIARAYNMSEATVFCKLHELLSPDELQDMYARDRMEAIRRQSKKDVDSVKREATFERSIRPKKRIPDDGSRTHEPKPIKKGARNTDLTMSEIINLSDIFKKLRWYVEYGNRDFEFAYYENNGLALEDVRTIRNAFTYHSQEKSIPGRKVKGIYVLGYFYWEYPTTHTLHRMQLPDDQKTSIVSISRSPSTARTEKASNTKSSETAPTISEKPKPALEKDIQEQKALETETGISSDLMEILSVIESLEWRPLQQHPEERIQYAVFDKLAAPESIISHFRKVMNKCSHLEIANGMETPGITLMSCFYWKEVRSPFLYRKSSPSDAELLTLEQQKEAISAYRDSHPSYTVKYLNRCSTCPNHEGNLATCSHCERVLEYDGILYAVCSLNPKN